MKLYAYRYTLNGETRFSTTTVPNSANARLFVRDAVLGIDPKARLVDETLKLVTSMSELPGLAAEKPPDPKPAKADPKTEVIANG